MHPYYSVGLTQAHPNYFIRKKNTGRKTSLVLKFCLITVKYKVARPYCFKISGKLDKESRMCMPCCRVTSRESFPIPW